MRMHRRFKRDKHKEEMYHELGGSQDSLFDTMKDVFILAACVGFQANQREKVSPGQDFHPSVFGQEDECIINTIVLAATHVDILHPDREEEKLTLFEEYANSGIDILTNKLLDALGNPLDNLIQMIGSEVRKNNSNFVDQIGEKLA